MTAKRTNSRNTPAGQFPEPAKNIISRAIAERATDIHIDSLRNGVRLCHRVDGVIHEKEHLDASTGHRLMNQIKVASRLSSEHTFEPLESSAVWADEDSTRSIRVTLAPTAAGESLHLRLLSPPEDIIEADQLGLSDDALKKIRNVLRSPEGLVLLGGPTGSGKTMSLYSLTSFLELDSVIAASIEDPVEYHLPYLRQLQADPEHGLTMFSGLRTLLRMDPDVLLVGEIRDKNSAATAAQAAASGRFVFATLHARDAAMAIEALPYLSVPYPHIAQTVRLIVAQNLVRRLCNECKTSAKPTAEHKKLFREASVRVPDRIFSAEGCEACHGYGHRGRTGIFQTVQVDDELQDSISSGQGARRFRELIEEKDIPSLRADALDKVRAGVTSMEEVSLLHWVGTSDTQSFGESNA